MISICMATYNGEEFIKEQIDSILCQLGPEDELVISDDGSNDKTKEIIFSYNDKRIKFFTHIPNKNFSGHEKASANFENALKNASGDFIFLSDQDDIWMNDKVSKCMKMLEKNDFVYHNAEYFFDDGRKEFVRFSKNPIPKLWLKNLFVMSLSGCCFAFNKKCLNLCLPFPDKLIGHDYWISTIAIKYCRTAYINDCLIKHRRYEESVSYNTQNTFCHKIKYRIILLQQFLNKFKTLNKK